MHSIPLLLTFPVGHSEHRLLEFATYWPLRTRSALKCSLLVTDRILTCVTVCLRTIWAGTFQTIYTCAATSTYFTHSAG